MTTHTHPGSPIAAVVITVTTRTGKRITLSASAMLNRRALGV